MIDTEKTNWRLVWLLWGAGLGAAAQYGKISVIFDQLPQVYPQAGASLGFAVSLVGAVGIVLGIVAGVLVAQIGYRRAILAALVMGAAMSALQASFPPLQLFLASRVVEGAAHLAIVVSAPTYIAQLSAERNRGFTMTLWGTFFGVSFTVLAWAGLPLVARFGLGSLLWAHAGFMALMAALLWPQLPRLSEAPARLRWAEVWGAHLRIYRSARIGAPALGWLFYASSFVAVLTVLPPYVDAGARAFVVGAMPLLSIVSSLTLGVWLLRRTGAISTILWGFAACATCALLLIILPGNAVVVLCLGASLGLVQGATFAAVPQLNEAPADRALANGGLAQMGNLGNTIGTPLMVTVVATAGQGGMALSLALLFATGGCLHFWQAKRRVAE